MPFRRNPKGRLRVPLAVRRFYQEQMIRLRFYRADIQKRITRQKRERDRQERDPYANPLFTEFPPELFPEFSSEQDSDAKGKVRHFIGRLFRRLSHGPSLGNDPDNNKANKAGLQILPAVCKLFDERIIRVPTWVPSWILSVITWMLSRLPAQLRSGHAKDQDSSPSEMNQVSIDRLSSGPRQDSSASENNRGDLRVRGHNECGQSTSISENSGALTVASLLMALLLFILPIYYFYTSRQPYPLYILIALAFAVVGFYKISKGEMRLFRFPLDTAVYLLPGLALISSIGAWNIGEAINLALLLSCCAALYWTVSSVVNSLAALRRFLAVIIAGTAAAAFLCLTRIFQEGASFPSAEPLGAISIAALLFGFYLRTASPSAAAKESTAAQSGGLATKGMAAALIQKAKAAFRKYRTTHQKEWTNIALSAASYLLLLAVIGLGSVLNYIMLSIGILLIMWRLQTDERKKCLTHFLPNAAAAFLAAGKVRLCLASGDITASWLWAALGLMIVITLEYTAVLTAIFLKRTGRRLRPWVRPGAALLLTLLLLYSSTVYLRSSLSPTSQPAYNYAQYYMEEKLLKGLDALSVMTSSPRILLQGTGGGGWESLVYQHQSFYYQDSPPGAFAQAGVEMGLPGLAVLLAVWILFIKEMRRIMAQKGARRVFRSINSHEQNAAHRERTERSGRTVGRDAASGQHKAAQLKGDARIKGASRPEKKLVRNSTMAADIQLKGDAWKVSWAVSHTNSCDKKENVLLKEAAWAIFTAAILVGIYSLVECTISMAAMSLFLFTLIGLGKTIAGFFVLGCSESPKHLEDTRSLKVSRRLRRGFRPHIPGAGKKSLQYLGVVAAVLLVMIISLNNFAGENCSLKAVQAIEQGEIQTAETNYKEAVHREPFNAEYCKELGKVYLKYDQAALHLACEQFKQGIHLARGDAELRTLYASTLLQTGQPEEGVWQLETAVSLRPLQQDLYENLALGYVTAAQLLQGWHGDLSSATSLLAGPLHPDYATGSKASHSHRNGFPDKTGNKTVPLPAELTSKKKAHLYLSRTMAIPKLLEKRAAQINKRHLRYWSGAPYLGITPKIQLYCGQAAVLLGDKKTARHYLEQAARDASLEPEAQRWHRRGAGTFPLPHF